MSAESVAGRGLASAAAALPPGSIARVSMHRICTGHASGQPSSVRRALLAAKVQGAPACSGSHHGEQAPPAACASQSYPYGAATGGLSTPLTPLLLSPSVCRCSVRAHGARQSGARLSTRTCIANRASAGCGCAASRSSALEAAGCANGAMEIPRCCMRGQCMSWQHVVQCFM
jgi:hypothetical protein